MIDAVRDRERVGGRRRASLPARSSSRSRASAPARAQRRAAVLDRLAAGGHALRSGVRAVSPEIIAMRVERQIELFGRDLRQRGQDALPQFDLAGEDGRACRRR